MKLSFSGILLLLFFASCLKKETSNEIVQNNLVNESKDKKEIVHYRVIGEKNLNLDVTGSNTGGSRAVMSVLYEGLFEIHPFDPTTKYIPNLAVDYPHVSDDGLIYTFKIHKGVFFHDDKAFPGGKGREINANDFIYCMKRLADPNKNSGKFRSFVGRIQGLDEWRSQMSKARRTDFSVPISGLKAIDNYTLQIRLTTPYPTFTSVLTATSLPPVAREVVEFYGEEIINHPIGTGPFYLESYQNNSEMVFKKFDRYRIKYLPKGGAYSKHIDLEDYKKPIPFIDKIVFQFMPEDRTVNLNFRKGKLAYISPNEDDLIGDSYATMKISQESENKGMKLYQSSGASTKYLIFNTKKFPINNKKVRQALAFAFDKQGMIDRIYLGLKDKAEGLFPKNFSGNRDEYRGPFSDPNIQKAKALLTEAGFPEGKGIPNLDFFVSTFGSYRLMAEQFAIDMKKIGINVIVRPQNFGQTLKSIKEGEGHIGEVTWGATTTESLTKIGLSPKHPASKNWAFFSNPEYDELYFKSESELDEVKREQLFFKMNHMINEDLAILPVYHTRNFTLTHKWVHNYFGIGNAVYIRFDRFE